MARLFLSPLSSKQAIKPPFNAIAPSQYALQLIFSAIFFSICSPLPLYPPSMLSLSKTTVSFLFFF